MIAAWHDADFCNQIDVGEGAAPKSDEPRRIETALQILETERDRVSVITNGGDVEQFTVRHDRGDLLNRDDHHFLAVANWNPLQVRGPRGRLVRIDRGVHV